MRKRSGLSYAGLIIAVLSGGVSIVSAFTPITPMGTSMMMQPTSFSLDAFNLAFGIVILASGLLMISTSMRLMPKVWGPLMIVYGLIMVFRNVATPMMASAFTMGLMLTLGIAMIASGFLMMTRRHPEGRMS